uniref:Methyltransferase domain-containing protein n=1 Tax=Syphacia muris TaxID=451379 RepID=A0A0N5ANH3_9BILA
MLRKSIDYFKYAVFQNSLRQQHILEEIVKITLEEFPTFYTAGAEVLQLGQNLIGLIRGKRVLDIGTCAGASAIAWALSLPEDGEVITMDIEQEAYVKYGKQLLSKRRDIDEKIDFRLGDAIDTLDSLIANDEAGRWDFAFIGADKLNYLRYYEKCLELLRPGGVIIVNNALWYEKVLNQDKDEETAAVDNLNRAIHNDERVSNVLLNISNGVNLVFKK